MHIEITIILVCLMPKQDLLRLVILTYQVKQLVTFLVDLMT